ncbi:unnamed protein product, partial [Hapterophycus canaliculatus]
QIENKLLLERFQRAADERDPRKVKGLFCHVPDESLEHTVLFGMGDSAALVDDCGSSSVFHAAFTAQADAYPSLRGWDRDTIDVLTGERSTINNTGARHFGNGKTPLEFPRAFSRHSTLEEEREYANTNQCDPETAASSLPEDSGRPLGGQRRRRHRGGGEGFAGAGQQDTAVSGLRFLALCRVMIGSMYVAPAAARSPVARRDRTNTGRCETDSVPSRDSSSPRNGTDQVALMQQQQQQQQDNPPCSQAVSPRDPFSLPPPPPGHADFDAVYFPLEEEYRLLNKDFVLPEFLVVHRFVATAPSSGSNKITGSSSGPYSTPSTTDTITDLDATSSADAGGHGSGGGTEARPNNCVAGGRAHEREQRQQHGMYGRPSGDAGRAGEQSSASHRPPQQDATSVVASIEAAIEGITPPHLLPRTTLGCWDGGSTMPGRAAAAAFSLTAKNYGDNDSNVSLSCGSTGGGRVASLPSDPSGRSGDTGVMNGSTDGYRGRERVRRCWSASRDVIVRDVEAEFECFWQEVFRLRKLEKDEVMKSALSRRKLRHPP